MRSSPIARNEIRVIGLLRATGDFEQVITKLSLHGTVDNVDLIVENDLVEFRDHLPLAKLAQVAAPLTGRAARVLFRDRAKVGSVGDLLFQFQTFGFVADQNVSSGCACRSMSAACSPC